jgi:hypothetical protein
MNSQRTPPTRDQSGFVLVLVLAMLVVLGLLAGSIAAVTSRLLVQSQQRAQAMQDAVDIDSTRATVLYLLATQRMTLGGLTVDNMVSAGEDGLHPATDDADLESWLPVGNEVALDGRANQGLGGARFALQDDYGLFGVNWNPPDKLEKFLAQGGQPRPVSAGALFNRLMDYQDRDNLYRLNSMEAEGYLAAGMPPPTNLPVATPMELMRVIGWQQALSFLSPAEITANLTVEPASIVNVNTAPLRVLLTVDGCRESGACNRVPESSTVPERAGVFRVSGAGKVDGSPGCRVSCRVRHFEAMAFARGASDTAALVDDPD